MPEPVTAAALLDQLVRSLEEKREAGLTRYQSDPHGFVADVLGQALWHRQAEALALLARHERVTVRSSHGVGKTFLAANAALWWLYSHRPSLVLTTAPTQRQVEGLLWGEINRLFRQAKQPLPGRCMQTKLVVSEEQQAIGLTTREPERFAGWHSEHLLVIVDEASGVPDALYEVIQGTLTSADCHLLLIGNPTQASRYFHASHHSEAWQRLKIAAHDTPNFAAGLSEGELPCPWLVTPAWAAARKAEWGEDSDPYRVRVLADFPRASADQLVALEWIERAEERSDDCASGPAILGVDVARYGDCETVLALRRGERLERLEAWQGADLMQTCGRVTAAAREWGATTIVIDAVGLGAGLVDRLQELKREGTLTACAVVGFESGGRALDPEHYHSRRDEAYWNLRERLREGEIGLAECWGKLTGQLCALKYRLNSRGRVQVESKEDLRRRRLPSPDWADAAMLAFANVSSGPLWLPRSLSGKRPDGAPLPRL